ncbi:AAA family ATPase [Crocinitomicaceae bacterium]|nr:AAA family ATPase [Crocinitomicaceae bacterium]
MLRIAITGPESSGKTTLARALSKVLSAVYIPEFARQYLQEKGLKYDQQDLDEIAKGQLNLILSSQNSINIVDSDFVVLKVWSDEKFQFTSSKISKLISENHFDLHILCAPDIPWEDDPMRENPDDRHLLFKKYVNVLNTYKKDFIIVSGLHDERLKKCVSAIHKLK